MTLAGTPAITARTSGPSSSGGTALDGVCRCFELGDFERLMLVLCAASELEGQVRGRARASAPGGGGRPYPTPFGLCLAALPGAHFDAIASRRRLRYWRLLEVGPGPLVAAPLRIDQWLLHVLVDAPGIDHRLFGLVSPVESAGPVPDAASAAVSALSGRLDGAGARSGCHSPAPPAAQPRRLRRCVRTPGLAAFRGPRR